MLGDLATNDGNELIGYMQNVIISTDNWDDPQVANFASSDIVQSNYYDTGVKIILPMQDAVNPQTTITNNQTVRSPSDGQRGGAIYLDGEPNTHIQISNLPLLNDFSVGLWMKTDTARRNYKKSQENIISQGSQRRIYIDTVQGKIMLDYNGSSYVVDNIGGYFQNNQWNHIALTRDSNGQVKAYINNNLALTLNVSPLSDNEDILIGDVAGDDTQELNSYIDEVTLFSKARQSSDIANLYSASNRGYQTLP